jgi:hypothetical protein
MFNQVNETKVTCVGGRGYEDIEVAFLDPFEHKQSDDAIVGERDLICTLTQNKPLRAGKCGGVQCGEMLSGQSFQEHLGFLAGIIFPCRAVSTWFQLDPR